MANFKLLIAACAILTFSGTTFAGFAQVAAPLSFTNASGVLQYQASANDVSFSNGAGVRGASGVINVGGRSVTMPAAYRFAANAPRIAARFAFGNPALLIGSAALLAYQYYQNQNFDIDNGQWVKDIPGISCTNGLCKQYRIGTPNWHNTIDAAANDYLPKACGTLTNCHGVYIGFDGVRAQFRKIRTSTGASLGDEYITPATQTVPESTVQKTQPVTQTEFEESMAGVPLPSGVPQVLPIPLPVELPILNPSADPVPQPQPMRVPQGLPQPVPNTDPQQWKSPAVDIVPSPTPDQPWRVDLQPKDITTTSPAPLPEAAPVPTPTASSPGDPEAPTTPDLCEKYPDIVACQKLDTVDDSTLENIDKNVTVNPESGWGGGGSCPASKHLTVNGRDIPIPLDLICDYMSGLRPIIIAMAWLSAGFILLGARGGD